MINLVDMSAAAKSVRAAKSVCAAKSIRAAKNPDYRARQSAEKRYELQDDGTYKRETPCGCNACRDAAAPFEVAATLQEGVQHELAALRNRRETWKNFSKEVS